MLQEIILFENILDIISKKNLSESQITLLITIIEENTTISPKQLLTTFNNIIDNKTIIMDGGQTYSIHPILTESNEVNLVEIVIPTIIKNIPNGVLSHLTEKHAVSIVNQILDTELNLVTSIIGIKQAINEMFSSGQILIPVQGLKPESTNTNIIMHGAFAPLLYKKLDMSQLLQSNKNKKTTLRSALTGYKSIDDTPLMKLLPKIVVTLKDLLGKKKRNLC